VVNVFWQHLRDLQDPLHRGALGGATRRPSGSTRGSTSGTDGKHEKGPLGGPPAARAGALAGVHRERIESTRGRPLGGPRGPGGTTSNNTRRGCGGRRNCPKIVHEVCREKAREKRTNLHEFSRPFLFDTFARFRTPFFAQPIPGKLRRTFFLKIRAADCRKIRAAHVVSVEWTTGSFDLLPAREIARIWAMRTDQSWPRLNI